MTAPNERVLRIGIVHSGSIVAERLIPPGTQTVTIGSSSDATFTVPVDMQTTPLFVGRRGRYRLNVPPGVRGRIQTSRGVLSLGDFLIDRGSRAVLEEGDRGKLVIGEVAVLFQLVDAPPVPAKVRGSFRPRLIDEDDPLFLGILSLCTAAATALMVHVAGLEPPALVQFEEVQSHFAQITLPLEPVEDAVAPEEPPEIEPVEVADAEPMPADPVEEVPTLSPADQAIADALAHQQRRDEVIQRSALLTQLINHGDGESVFGDYDPSAETLQLALDGIDAGPDLVSADGGVRGASSRRGRGEAELEGCCVVPPGHERVDVVEAPDAIVAEREPSGEVVPEQPEVPDDIRAQIRRHLPTLAAYVRTCYERRIKDDPTISGRLVVEVDLVGGRGVDAYASGIQDPELLSCVERKANTWKVPGVDGETLSLPFALTPGG